MKYLFLNVTAGGSTGRIAAAACRRLQTAGHECVLAYGRGDARSCPDVDTWRIGTAAEAWLHAAATRLGDAHGFAGRGATRRFLDKVRRYDPDIIWMHNLHGYYINVEMLFSYLKTCRKRIFWTLHDCWAFTGHCAHFLPANCNRWRTGCGECPLRRSYPASLVADRSRRNFARKRAAFCGVENMTLLFPCRWLERQAAAGFLAEYPRRVVPNRVDKRIFRPTAGDFRRRYGLKDKKLALAAAGSWGPDKGLADVYRLAGLLGSEWAVAAVGLSPAQQKQAPAGVLALGPVEDPRELAALYTAADVFVNPTRADTFPTVNLEAAACGTPVVTYDTGGARETLDENGRAVACGDLEDMCRQVWAAWERGRSDARHTGS